MLQSDFFIDSESAPNSVGGLINVKKIKRVLQLVQRFEESMHVGQHLLIVFQVQKKIDEMVDIDGDVLMQMSNRVENEGQARNLTSDERRK
jgi:hypothetical protein